MVTCPAQVAPLVGPSRCSHRFRFKAGAIQFVAPRCAVQQHVSSLMAIAINRKYFLPFFFSWARVVEPSSAVQRTVPHLPGATNRETCTQRWARSPYFMILKIKITSLEISDFQDQDQITENKLSSRSIFYINLKIFYPENKS